MRVYLALGICILVLVSLYILVQYTQSKESFDDHVQEQEQEQGQTQVEVEPPFTIAPINEVDDYEYSLVFKNEGTRGITKANRDLLMSSYPMDWSTQPPSSAAFEQGLADFKSNLSSQTPQTAQSPYASLEGFTPPDTEKEILSTYVPKKPQELTTYSAEDAKSVIDKIYSAKGQIADMKPSPANSNVFIITGVRNKGAPMEEESEASQGAVASAGENRIIAPVVYTSENEGLDPFFTPGDLTKDGKWDYTRFTPGLERSFAPNQPMKNWY